MAPHHFNALRTLLLQQTKIETEKSLKWKESDIPEKEHVEITSSTITNGASLSMYPLTWKIAFKMISEIGRTVFTCTAVLVETVIIKNSSINHARMTVKVIIDVYLASSLCSFANCSMVDASHPERPNVAKGLYPP